jgi:hypothetical protein
MILIKLRLIWPETIKVKRMDDRKNSISTRLCK